MAIRSRPIHFLKRAIQRLVFQIFSLPLHSKVRLLSRYVVCLSSVVWNPSVSRVYCDETTEARIMHFLLEVKQMSYF